MPEYRRAFVPGGTFFFTLVTEGREPPFHDEHNRLLLRRAIARCRASRPFDLDAIILLPEHLHLMLTLPDGDANFSTRIAAVKAMFTKSFLDAGGREAARTESRIRHRNRGVWQRRFWEHVIRDEDDEYHHLDYIHFNAVKHHLVTCPHAWPHSSFEQFVARGQYDRNWLCACDGRVPVIPTFHDLRCVEMD